MSCVGDCGGLDTGRDGALDSEQGRGPGPVVGSGPDTVTPESLNNAQRAAGPIGPGRVKAREAGQGKLVRRKEKPQALREGDRRMGEGGTHSSLSLSSESGARARWKQARAQGAIHGEAVLGGTGAWGATLGWGSNL